MDISLAQIHEQLEIGPAYLKANRLPVHEQPPLSSLEVVDIDFEGKPFILIAPAAKAWRRMTRAAAADGIRLLPFSGFRSYLHQRGIIERYLKNGRPLEEILTQIAIPGFSEHHSGRAVDICTDGHVFLEQSFEQTPAFDWLVRNAGGFDFRLSYPRGNGHGIIFEPWHWFYTSR